MPLRISTNSTYSRVLVGLRGNQLASIRAQEQIATGRRILRPSDDPSGAVKALAISRQIADIDRIGSSVRDGRALVDTAASGLESGSQLMGEAQALLLQGLNGTLSDSDRESLASSFDLLRSQMIDLANLRSGDRYLFSGTENSGPPWVEENEGGQSRVVYRGNQEDQVLRVGDGVDVGIGIPGTEIFGKANPSGTRFSGLTGAASGVTADQGRGYEYVRFRHDSTDPSDIATVGISLVNGGGDDTILGDNSLVVDAAAGTIRIGSGPARTIPSTTDSEAADFVLTNSKGGELHLDLSGFSGADYTGTLRGDGSVSLDGSAFTSVDFTEANLELVNEGTGTVLHVDTTGVKRAGEELVTFGGTVNVFDLLQGISEDLRNGEDLSVSEVQNHLQERLQEMDHVEDDLLVGLGVLGSRSQRLNASGDRALDLEVALNGLLSDVQDADLAEVALDLARSEFSLQAAQASGARLLQNSLLNFLG
ncbi:MAG: flagellar hook-associated protein 3 FlgL [Planctomycetota bacterium]|jgi:flagellar hook-associated protein 3 FlgL